jgi:hypothetical protein
LETHVLRRHRKAHAKAGAREIARRTSDWRARRHERRFVGQRVRGARTPRAAK